MGWLIILTTIMKLVGFVKAQTVERLRASSLPPSPDPRPAPRESDRMQPLDGPAATSAGRRSDGAMAHISEAQFAERFVAVILGHQDLPKRRLDMHILLTSVVLGLDPARRYSERDLNEELQKWVRRFGEGIGLDHVTLRRLLVDSRYLERDSSGASYRLKAGNPAYTFDPTVRALDLDRLIDEAVRQRAQRKRLHAQEED